MSQAIAQNLPKRLVFRCARAIDPRLGLDAVVDVLVENGRIAAIGADLDSSRSGAEATHVIEARGRWLLPGLVEVHAHFREPGFEYKEDIESGLRAAAAGGYAHVCVMPNTRPVNDTPSITTHMLARARAVGGPTLHPISAITLGLRGEELVDMAAQKAVGAVGFSDDGRCLTSAVMMRKALLAARELDMPVIQHAEEHSMTAGAVMNEGQVSRRLGLPGWPREAEDVIVARDLVLAEATGARYHLAHASTRGTVRMLREAKARGVRVTSEAAPHHLVLDERAVESLGTQAKVNPPLREPQDVQALVEALADGTIDCIATDHAPHSSSDKQQPLQAAPPGVIGLELCLPMILGLVRSGALGLGRMIQALTSSPAALIGIQAPSLKVGAPAELCLVDPDAAWVVEPAALHSKSFNTPLLGETLCGRVDLTLAAGGVVWDRRGQTLA